MNKQIKILKKREREMEGKKVKQERKERPVLWKPSPKCQHPPTMKERCWAHTRPRRCEGSTALRCSGQQVPSGLSTTLHGVGWGDTGKALAAELITARGSHRQVTDRRPEGPHKGGRAGRAAAQWTPANSAADIPTLSFLPPA